MKTPLFERFHFHLTLALQNAVAESSCRSLQSKVKNCLNSHSAKSAKLVGLQHYLRHFPRLSLPKMTRSSRIAGNGTCLPRCFLVFKLFTSNKLAAAGSTVRWQLTMPQRRCIECWASIADKLASRLRLAVAVIATPTTMIATKTINKTNPFLVWQ